MKTDLLAGLTVALALVPEAVAFAFVAHVHPLVGLYAAFIVGLVTALIGGRPGMISGATGALAVVMVSLVAVHGVEYLFATVVLMGILQLLAGIFRMGKFIRLVPHPVMLGFVNGLAIVIFLAQMSQFQVPGTAEAAGHGLAGGQWMSGVPLALMLALVGLTMAIIWGLPKFTKVIPAPLAGIGIVAAVVIGFGLDVPRVGDMASIEGGLPQFHIPSVPMNFETLKIILPYSFIMAAVGLIESLLTLNLVGEMTGKRGGTSQECVAQGTANLITGFFGSTDKFAELFHPESDPDVVIVDSMRSRVVDQSALQANEDLARKSEALGKTLQLRHLSHDCHKLLSKAGQLIVDSDDDPDYELAVDYSVRTGAFGGGH